MENNEVVHCTYKYIYGVVECYHKLSARVDKDVKKKRLFPPFLGHGCNHSVLSQAIVFPLTFEVDRLISDLPHFF